MTRKEIIDGLKFTVEMFLFDSSSGEKITEPRNDMDKTTIDACRGAIELLEQEPIDVLDKIRAEIIERDRNVKAIRSDGCCFFTVEEVLKIIDKYKESEGEG